MAEFCVKKKSKITVIAFSRRAQQFSEFPVFSQNDKEETNVFFLRAA